MWNPVDNGLRVTSRSLAKRNCGIGPGGFQKGNTCASGDGGDGEGYDTEGRSADEFISDRVQQPIDDWNNRTIGQRVKDKLLFKSKPEPLNHWSKVRELANVLGVADKDPVKMRDEFGTSIVSHDKWDRVKYGKSTTEAAYDVISKAKSLGFEQVHLTESRQDHNGEGYNGGEVGMVNREGIAMHMTWRYGRPDGVDPVNDGIPEGRKGRMEYRFIYPNKQQQEVYRKNREWADEAIKVGDEALAGSLEEAGKYLALTDTEKAKAAYERGFKILEERRKEDEARRNRPFLTKLYEGIKSFIKSAWNWITGNGWTANYDSSVTDNNCGTGPNGFEGGNECGGYKPVSGTDDLPPRKKARKPKYPKVRMARAGSAEGMSRIDEYRGARSVRKGKKYVPVDNNCGVGKGGFQPGNTCAKSSEKTLDRGTIRKMNEAAKFIDEHEEWQAAKASTKSSRMHEDDFAGEPGTETTLRGKRLTPIRYATDKMSFTDALTGAVAGMNLGAVADHVIKHVTGASSIAGTVLGGVYGGNLLAKALGYKDDDPNAPDTDEELADYKEVLQAKIDKVSSWSNNPMSKRPKSVYEGRIAKFQRQIEAIEAEQARRAGSR